MKIVIAVVVFIAGGIAGTYYGSCYILGGIEGGMHEGGNGQFAEYHEGNLITEFFIGESGGYQSTDFDPGDVDSNPFVK